MKFIEKGDGLVFSTGKQAYCYSGVVGFRFDAVGADAQVFYGHDGVIPTEPAGDGGGFDPVLTPVECAELAEHMIAAWTAYRDAVKALAGEKETE